MRFAFRKFEALNEEVRRRKREELNQERAKARKQVKGKGPIKNKRIRAVARENKKKIKNTSKRLAKEQETNYEQWLANRTSNQGSSSGS